MKSLITLLHENGKYKFAIFFLVIGFGLQYLLIAHFLPEFLNQSRGLKNPDQLFSYRLDYLYNLYKTLGTEGRKLYAKMLYVDFGYTIIAALGYSLLLAALSKQRKWFILLPLILALFDIAENIFQFVLMNQFPNLTPIVTILASISTSTKMILGITSILLIVYYSLYNIIRWIRRNWNQSNKNI